MIDEFYKSELIKILSEIDIPIERVPEGDAIKQIYAEIEGIKKLAYLRGKKDGLKIMKEFISE